MNISEVTAALEAMTRLSRYLMADASKTEQLTNNQIVSCKALLPNWTNDEIVEKGVCKQYQDKVYRCIQPHTTQADWTPDATPALWAVIDVAHAGTLSDPIPASRGMDYIYGKHYADPEDGKTYLCTRQGATEGGTINLQYLPHELTGQYFEEVAV